MANQGGGGNEHSGGDVIVLLHSAVMHLQHSMVRHHAEVQETFARLQETISRHHKETMGTSAGSQRSCGVGDKLRDHERRLAAVEAKVS